MTHIQYAWMIYVAGSLGCCLAVWGMFFWAWRFIRYSAVVTLIVILFTPFAIEQETMALAPAIFTLVFEGMAQGEEAIKPLLKLMAGIWLIAIILVSVFVILTRNLAKDTDTSDSYEDYDSQHSSAQSRRVKRSRPSTAATTSAQAHHTNASDLSAQEQRARAELMSGELPMRAIRD